MAQQADKKEKTLFRTNAEYCQEQENCEKERQLTRDWVEKNLPPKNFSISRLYGFTQEEYRESLIRQGKEDLLDLETRT